MPFSLGFMSFYVGLSVFAHAHAGTLDEKMLTLLICA